MASVRTEWSCGCSDVYNFDRHEGMSYLCNEMLGACVQKRAKEDKIILFPLGDPADGQDA